MGETIDLTTADGKRITAYRASPAGMPRAGLVVLQEIFGVNAHIRAVADGFAAQGYLVIAPALFDRVEPGVELTYQPRDFEKGRDLRGKIPLEETLTDIDAAVKAAASAGKVGVVGYCWGGTLAFAAAQRLDGIAGVVGYYGAGIASGLGKPLKVPVELHFGEKDRSIPAADIEKIRQAFPEIPIYLYPAGHGFNRAGDTDHEKASADLARERTLGFFARTVG